MLRRPSRVACKHCGGKSGDDLGAAPPGQHQLALHTTDSRDGGVSALLLNTRLVKAMHSTTTAISWTRAPGDKDAESAFSHANPAGDGRDSTRPVRTRAAMSVRNVATRERVQGMNGLRSTDGTEALA
jgi:hypothetical protein